MQCWIEKTISRVDYENGKGLIHRVTVTDVEGLSKTVGCDTTMDHDLLSPCPGRPFCTSEKSGIQRRSVTAYVGCESV